MGKLAQMLGLVLGLTIAAPAAAQPSAVESSASRLERITASGVLKACIWTPHLSISYRNPRSGELEGLDVEMALALASELGVTVQFVDTALATFMDDLAADACDIAMFGIAVTPTREKKVAFSEPYLRSGIIAVTSKVNPRIKLWQDIDRPGVVVAVLAGSYMAEILSGSLRYARLTVVTPPGTREEEVESGRADVFVTNIPYTRRILEQQQWVRIIEPPTPVFPTNYAYAVKRNDPLWLDRINLFVNAAKRDGRLQAIARHYDLADIVLID